MQISIRNKYAPLAKNFIKGYRSVVTNVCDMSLITACAIFRLQSKVSCCLHMYFLWRHHLPSDKSENDQDIVTLIDWFTYDIWLLTLLFSLPCLSESYFAFGNDNKCLLPNPWVVLFSVHFNCNSLATISSLRVPFTHEIKLASCSKSH
jgi:hypothetical protein